MEQVPFYSEKIQLEYDKIKRCLTKVGPVVLAMLETTFKDNHIEFTLTGKGLEMKYNLTKGKLSCSFFLRNLFLEIATADRDKEPLQYDSRCDDPEFLSNRVMGVIASKLAPLLPMMAGTDLKDIEKIARKNHPSYERFKVIDLDGRNMSKAMLRKIEEGHMP